MRGFEPYADDMTLEFVEGCGHLMPEERPEVVLSRATAFFAGEAGGLRAPPPTPPDPAQ